MKLFSIENIIDFLPQLNEKPADELEGQQLDFKEWGIKSLKDSVDEVIEMAVCMAETRSQMENCNHDMPIGEQHDR